MAELVLVRHGETEWSAAHRHTSDTDLALTRHGEEQARALGRALAGRRFARVLCSPRTRARQTAELADLPVDDVVDDLVEWRYGAYEGLTTAEIRERRPGWRLWDHGCPEGESPDEVGDRIDRVLRAVTPHLRAGDRAGDSAGDRAGDGPGDRAGDVVLVGHGHALRVVASRWIGLPASAGGLFRLDVGRVSVLGHEREQPVLLRWNSPT